MYWGCLIDDIPDKHSGKILISFVKEGCMNKSEFDLLTLIYKNKKTRLEDLSKVTRTPLARITQIVEKLKDDGILSESRKKEISISEKGELRLEPYRVRKMLIIAAGFGSRLVPVTLNTPKPLIRVNGTRIIDTILDASLAAGIEDITIVRGYLSEQFDQLLYKYPNLKFVYNPYFNEANNISSLYISSSQVDAENMYIAEADLLISNPSIIEKYQWSSNYLGVPVKRTDDWCFTVSSDKDSKIQSLSVGGYDCYHMFGISFWAKTDVEKLYEDVRKAWLLPGGKEKYWDQVPLDIFKDDFSVSVRKCSFSDIAEIDTFRELQDIDHSYCY